MNKRRCTAPVLLVLLCLVLAQLVACGPGSTPPSGNESSSLTIVHSRPPQPEPEPEPEPEPLPELRVRFSAVGDNLIHGGIWREAKKRAGGEGYDFAYAYADVAYFFQDYDVNWMNQESLVMAGREPSGYPMFCTPAEIGTALYDVGWRVFSLSNNHSYDKGASGITDTLDFWASMPEDVRVAGFYTEDMSDASIVTHEVNGITIAYLSYTEHSNGLPTPGSATAHVIYTSQLETIEWQVRQASQLADAVVVSVHWGVEGSHNVTDAQRSLAQNLADWGATAVIGTHPHVMQPMEELTAADGRSVPVAYSLGNFLSTQEAAPNLVGLILTFELVRTPLDYENYGPLAVENIRVYPTVTHYEQNRQNIGNHMLRDYTDELAQRHFIRGRQSNFSVEYCQTLASKYIDPQYLVLD